jgi:hypothetical protein
MPNTYRIQKGAAAPALLVKAFEHYNEALAYSRATGSQARPIRRLEGSKIMWHVPTLAPTISTKPRAVKVPCWVPPRVDAALVAAVLDRVTLENPTNERQPRWA